MCQLPGFMKRIVIEYSPYVIESSSCHLAKIILDKERMPMVLEDRIDARRRLESIECVFVNDCAVVQVLEKGRSDPRLKNEPSAEVDAANFGRRVVERRRCGSDSTGSWAARRCCCRRR